MPGTIHVTVVEFKGVSSSPKPSAKSLKVSMGKRQYQTWDKGDFSFPITRIGEDIVVALLDAGGNEIAHQDIGTMQVIEKGSWDEVFFINGGGHVHLKLHFTLSEEDRSRIRVMRESAMKKKLETNPNIKLRFLEYFTSTAESAETSMKDGQKVSDLTSPEVEASRAGSSPASAASSAASLSSHRMGGGAVVDSGIPNATDGIQDAPPSSHVEHKIDVESARVADVGIQTPRLAGVGSDNGDGPSSEMSSLVASTLQDDHLVRKPQKQGPVGKTPSNVRKMISAFETSQIQEFLPLDFKQGVKSMKRAASVPSHLNRSSKEGFLEDRPTKSVSSTADKTSTDFKDHHLKNLHTLPTAVSERASKVSSECEPPQVKKELPSTVTPTLSESSDNPYAEYMSRASSSIEVEEGEKSSLDIRRKIASETATSSGRMSEERSQPEISSRLLKSSESSAAEASGRGRGTSLKSSTVINAQVVSNLKQRTLEYYKEEYDSAQASGMWIFPDNTSRLCITTAGEQDMKIVGHYNNETKTHQANIISSENQKNSRHEKERKMGKKLKRLDHQPESGSAGSPNDSSNGLIGQVIKVAVIVGFGVLVLLTRQKEPCRNKQKEDKDKDKDNLFYIPDYVDERALKPWTGKP
ncbi:uncharacterized protein LOC130988449 isoform X6 [Salvia miltiorrhiza]|uniref:uncharacterized protein LOC130988449 isoform X6 n=1 Tax=Salvia miltiorrhiza TaxID=226208 RepID=UPI0025AC5573|nr:uncharacterized protein LOC130988449 isoform X6 [Salvia miltiorrhiza]